MVDTENPAKFSIYFVLHMCISVVRRCSVQSLIFILEYLILSNCLSPLCDYAMDFSNRPHDEQINERTNYAEDVEKIVEICIHDYSVWPLSESRCTSTLSLVVVRSDETRVWCGA